MFDGVLDGVLDGVGVLVGVTVPELLGVLDGVFDDVGVPVCVPVGVLVGELLGVLEGVLLGVLEGVLLGVLLAVLLGVGVLEGLGEVATMYRYASVSMPLSCDWSSKMVIVQTPFAVSPVNVLKGSSGATSSPIVIGHVMDPVGVPVSMNIKSKSLLLPHLSFIISTLVALGL